MENIIQEFEKAENELISRFSALSDVAVNKKLSPESWSAAQVAEHIIKAQSNFPQLMQGKSTNTERDPEEKREMIRKMFLDFSTKMKSPEFILPSAGKHDKEQMLEQIRIKKEEIETAMRAADLSRTYSDFELPGFGPFTGFEWGWFIIYHTERHIDQIKNITAAAGK